MPETRNSTISPEHLKKKTNNRAVAIAALSLVSLASCTQKDTQTKPTTKVVTTELASRETTTTTKPEETTTTTSPEQRVRAGIEQLDAQKKEILAALKPVEPEKMDKLINIAQNGTVLGWSEGTHYRTVKKSKDGSVYTIDAVYDTPTVDAQNTKPDSIGIYVRKPGDKSASSVLIDGTVGSQSTYEYNLSSPLDGVIDAPLDYENSEEAMAKTAASKLLYPEDQQLRFANDDVSTLRNHGAQAQADYINVVNSIVE
jgi:hypothetical protein